MIMMKPSSLFTSLALPLTSFAAWDGQATVDNIKFDFRELKGVHTVSYRVPTPPTISNTSWAFNPTGVLGMNPDVPAKDQCPENSQICGIQHILLNRDGDKEPTDVIREIIPIAGDNIKGIKESSLALNFTRLKTVPGSKQTGLKVELHGGEYGDVKQKAIVDFICDKEKTGNELPKDGKGGALKYVEYSDKRLLWLEWSTKYACESLDDDKPVQKKSGWGFFTWFILIAFLAIAAYLIFGSYVNYNRYGARGWDLLPHSDTLRDLPYLIKDFARRIVFTFQGSGGRGGYSAV